MIRKFISASAAIWLALAPLAAIAADQNLLKPSTGSVPHPVTFGTGDTVGVPHGGTGLVTLTTHCVVVGQGASTPHLVCPSTSGLPLTSAGVSADAAFGAIGCNALPALTGDVATSAGACATTIGANKVTLADIVQIGANSILGNATASTANIAAQSMPSCSAASSALTWTTSSGFGCNTISAGGGTVSSVATTSGITGGACTTTCTISNIGTPQPSGRLTLVSGVPVMTGDQTAKSTIYETCYGGNRMSYYDGAADQVEAISGCEVSLTMATSSTGVTNSGGVFDIAWVHSGANRICVVTNGSGGGWASDTGGSNIARGTGYSAVHNTRGYYTFTNGFTHCYNGATDYGSVSGDQATYLGSVYTTAAGQTSMLFSPAAAAGGSAPVLGLWNAYNRVLTSAGNSDSTASWTKNSTTIGAMDAGAPGSGLNNSATYIDGLAQSIVIANNSRSGGSAGGDIYVGMARDSTTLFDCSSQASVSAGIIVTVTVPCRWLPSAGVHSIQENEATATSAMSFYGSFTTPTRRLNVLFVELEM